MSSRRHVTLAAVVAALAWGCGQAYTQAAPAAPREPKVHGLPLPGAPPGGVSMDYITYDQKHHRVWIPAGNTGSVDVVDVKNEKITQVEGFPTLEVERGGTKRVVGPSSATVGEGVVYIGNRGDSSVCAVDAVALKKGACLKLDSSPDGLAYIAATKEVWVTTPRDKSIVILDASTSTALAVKAKISLEGLPEGFAVDDARGVFYTNLEDKNRTLSIDVRSHAVTKTWTPKCGDDGPRGLAIDHQWNFLFVACTDHINVLDAGHDGALLSSIDTGAGIDDINYVPSRHELYAAAGRAAKLTVARLDAQGKLTPVASVPTATGARNAVATEDGVAYLTDSLEGKMLVVAPAH